MEKVGWEEEREETSLASLVLFLFAFLLLLLDFFFLLISWYLFCPLADVGVGFVFGHQKYKFHRFLTQSKAKIVS